MNQLIQLFEQGYSASGALAVLKMDLQMECSADEYVKKSADRSLIPDVHFVQKLYQKTRQTAYGQVNETASQPACSDQPANDESAEVYGDEETQREYDNPELTVDEINNQIISEKSMLFDELSAKIDDCMHDGGVLASLQKMRKDLSRIRTSSEMISFLHGVRPAAEFQVRSKIRCQPTAVACRRPALGRGSQPAPLGRPAGLKRTSEHGFATSRERKPFTAPHSLSYCVSTNSAVGRKHHK